MAHNEKLTDAVLIERCLEQDAEAWEALVRRYQRLIASIANKYGLGNDDAADVLQTVCFTLFQQLPALRQQEKLSSWVITVAVRECWKLRRRQVSTEGGLASFDDPEIHIIEPADPAQPLPEDTLMAFERQHLLRQAVLSLAEPCQALLMQLFYRDVPLPYTEISRQLGIPIASIGPTRSRCLNKLKATLENSDFFSA